MPHSAACTVEPKRFCAWAVAALRSHALMWDGNAYFAPDARLLRSGDRVAIIDCPGCGEELPPAASSFTVEGQADGA